LRFSIDPELEDRFLFSKGGIVEFDSSRRKFLQAGLALPAAGLVASHYSDAFGQAPAGVVYRKLGNTGLKVSAVGCGIGVVPDPAVLNHAVDLGVNYFDTARMYGKSEDIAGEAFKGKRNRNTPDAITDEAVEACETLKKQGKTRFIGVSSHDIYAVVDRIVSIGKFDVVQTTYSYPINSHLRTASIKKLYDSGIGVVAMKVIIAVAGIIPPKELRLKGEGPLAAVKWVLMNPMISTTVPYAKNIAELEMNFRAMKEPYSIEDEKVLYARSEEIRSRYCRMCYECKGKCPNGVPVTDELRYLAYNDFGANFGQAQENFRLLPEQIRRIRCNDCSSCAVQCPNGVDVQSRLIRAQTLLA
jgi:uncharacterized protein